MAHTPRTPASTRSGKKVANSLLSLSSAAVLAIYAAGYERTQSAAEELEAASAQRRPGLPAPQRAATAAAGATMSSARVAAPNVTAAAPEPAAVLPAAAAGSATETPAGAPASSRVSSGAAESLVAKVAPKPEVAPARPTAPDKAAPAGKTMAAGTTVPAGKTVPAAEPQLVARAGESAAATPPALATAATEAAVATAAPASAAPAAAAPLPRFKDGTYRAWGRSRHGDIFAFVVIENGRVVHSGVDRCRTRWSCDLVSHLGPQVVQRQTAEVDYVSGATESGNAFYYGVLEALNMAQGLTPIDPANDPK